MSRAVGRRSLRACDKCRVKKTKCNGALPCERCYEEGTPCNYSRGSSHGKRDSRTPLETFADNLQAEQQHHLRHMRAAVNKLVRLGLLPEPDHELTMEEMTALIALIPNLPRARDPPEPTATPAAAAAPAGRPRPPLGFVHGPSFTPLFNPPDSPPLEFTPTQAMPAPLISSAAGGAVQTQTRPAPAPAAGPPELWSQALGSGPTVATQSFDSSFGGGSNCSEDYENVYFEAIEDDYPILGSAAGIHPGMVPRQEVVGRDGLAVGYSALDAAHAQHAQWPTPLMCDAPPRSARPLVTAKL